MAELVFFRRNEELMRVNLEGRKFTVGRAPTNDILVPDSTVSRQQFSVEQVGDGWVLKDLSGRGTDVGGKISSEAPLADGIDIGLGQLRAVFNLTDTAGYAGDTTEQRAGESTVIEERDTGDARIYPARLRVRTDKGDEFLPFQQELTVGSAVGKGVLRLDDPFVSSSHARLERRGNNFRVQDLGSRNGTFLGAVRVFDAEVPFATPIRIGSAELTLIKAEKELEASTYEGMVGNDPSMRKVFETIDRVAPSQAQVAIFGESGTGKELVARAIHQRSPRSDKPFIPVNCGAISKDLVESELFGHEKGAFTGADRLRKGAFEEAHEGTLFLDEIGELPLSLQAKLLRALELGEIKRLGATRPMNVDVRIVAATNRDLRQEIRKGTFREDLYWRLCVIPLQLPPLRARKGDLKALIAHFLKVFSPAGALVGLGPGAQEKLLNHDWPGNVRELKNAVHRALLLRLGATIESEDVTFDRDLDMAQKVSEPESAYDPDADDLHRVHILDKTLEAVEDETYSKTCRRLGARASLVAKALGVSRGAAYRRMDKLGIAQSKDPKDAAEGGEE